MKILTNMVISALISTITPSVLVRADIPATHGMLLFGQNTTYASHLPMLHSPHDYQVILSLALADLPASHTLQAYSAAKVAGAPLFTLVPELMDLTQVISGAKSTFKAVIYQGHFEQGGKALGSVNASVTQVIFSDHLVQNTSASNPEQYLAFGESGEYYAAHLIHPAPGVTSFDSVMHVGQPYQVQGVCHKRYCPDFAPHPVTDDELPLTLSGGTPKAGQQLGSLGGVISDVLETIYYNESDLAP